MHKDSIREKIRAQRFALSDGDIANSSAQITKHLLLIDALRSAKTIAIYIGFANEVDTRQIIGWLWKLGKQVCVPVVVGDDMKFAKLTSKSKMKLNRVGVPEPITKSFMDIKKIAVFVVPGVAFAPDGHRVGSGKGFYDRFFNKKKVKALKIGIAYGFQLVEKIVVHEHDVPMDLVVTENGVVVASNK